jgi:hypothetical protein
VTGVLRRATAEVLPEIITLDSRPFGVPYTDIDVELFRPLFEPDRFLLACDPVDGRISAPPVTSGST